MSTIQNMSRRVQAAACTYIPKKLHPRFFTGIEALATRSLGSLNANGRSLCENRWTGEVRIRRTVTEERFPHLLLRVILKEYVPRTGRLRLSLDHSTFGTFTLAVFALSAGKGHPLLKPLIKGLAVLLGQLSYQQRKRLVVVMDRWFAIPDLLAYLDAAHIGFVVRLKQDTPLGVPWVEPHRTTVAGEVSLPDTPVTYHSHDWRLVRSDLRPGMKSTRTMVLVDKRPYEPVDSAAGTPYLRQTL